MKKPFIPKPKPGDPESLEAIRQNMNIITGRVPGTQIPQLSSTATQQDIINTLNAVIVLLMG